MLSNENLIKNFEKLKLQTIRDQCILQQNYILLLCPKKLNIFQISLILKINFHVFFGIINVVVSDDCPVKLVEVRVSWSELFINIYIKKKKKTCFQQEREQR